MSAPCRKTRGVLRPPGRPGWDSVHTKKQLSTSYSCWFCEGGTFFLIGYISGYFGLHLNLLQEQVDRELTVFPTSYWMKLIQIWHQKEEILCGKDANSGIQSKNIHDQKGGPGWWGRKSWVFESKLGGAGRLTFQTQHYGQRLPQLQVTIGFESRNTDGRRCVHLQSWGRQMFHHGGLVPWKRSHTLEHIWKYTNRMIGPKLIIF